MLIITALAAAQENVPGTRVSIWPPVEMAPASRFAGFESPDGKAALMITEMPVTTGDVTAAFRDAGKAAAAGMRLIQIDQANHPSGPLEIFVMEQANGGVVFRKQS